MALFVVGCSEDPPDEPKPDPETQVAYRIVGHNIYPLRAGEYYSLWVKEAPDSSFRFIQDSILHVYYPFDSSQYFGKFDVKYSIDSLREVLLTIERTKTPITPGLVVLHGVVEREYNDVMKGDSIYSVLKNASFDSMLNTSGMLTFASPSSDSLAYTKEFYFMRPAGPAYAPSIQSLPYPPTGWRYATWVYDTDFFPPHQFFYGYFDTSLGHDSDSANDSYAFPGGAKSQPQNVASGLIMATLEPMFYGDSIRLVGPSPFRILQYERSRFIVPDNAYQMQSEGQYSLPTMSISFKRK